MVFMLGHSVLQDITEAIKNVERQLAKNGFNLPRKAETPL